MITANELKRHLEHAGLRVVVIEGADGRGRPGPFNPVGQLNHHTGSSAKGWSLDRELGYAKSMFLVGRPDLSPPLCHGSVGRSGTIYIGAMGRANHGGDAKPSGSVAGGNANELYWGWEWMLSGYEEIPAVMMQAGITLNAVVAELVTNTSEQTISCHYNTSVTGKWDIGDPNGVNFKGAKVLDIDKFRREVREERTRLFDAETPKPEPAVHYRWSQAGKLGESVSGCAIGVKKVWGSVLRSEIILGSKPTSEGKDTPSGNGHGIDARYMQRVVLKHLQMVFAVLGGHAPPERAKNARAAFMRIFSTQKAKMRGGDLNLVRRAVALLFPTRILVGQGVLWLVLDRRAFKLIKGRAVNVGGDHKAILATVKHRKSGEIFTVQVINCMSYSAPKARAMSVFKRGLDFEPDILIVTEATDFRCHAVDARHHRKAAA